MKLKSELIITILIVLLIFTLGMWNKDLRIFFRILVLDAQVLSESNEFDLKIDGHNINEATVFKKNRIIDLSDFSFQKVNSLIIWLPCSSPSNDFKIVRVNLGLLNEDRSNINSIGVPNASRQDYRRFGKYLIQGSSGQYSKPISFFWDKHDIELNYNQDSISFLLQPNFCDNYQKVELIKNK